jgi:ribonucleoside-diphosphate reductase alpha chain
MRETSAFINLAAVEAWDAWFRWRREDELRDISIHDSWTRVSCALACAEKPGRVRTFEQRLGDALAEWQVLLDERILVTAGTGASLWPDDELIAVLNLASFVRAPATSQASLNLDALESAAELAVNALDNAATLAANASDHSGMHLRIGLVGLADALALLGVRYDSDTGRNIARDIAAHLASGCLYGTLRLARERGARLDISECLTLGCKLRELSGELAAEAERLGLRQSRLTAITSQPRLALLANNVTDAIDPLLMEKQQRLASIEMPLRAIHSTGYTVDLMRRLALPPPAQAALLGTAMASVSAQIELRTAMQMWIDEPILYPLSGDVSSGSALDTQPR